MDTFFHVSSYAKEGQVFTKQSKMNFDFCEYICINDFSIYENALSNYKEMIKIGFASKTGRISSKWLCEAIFESVRKQYYSTMPSRVWGIYLCKTKNEATIFNQNFRGSKGRVFEVNVSNVVRFNMNLFTEAHELIVDSDFSVQSYEKALLYAHAYWQNQSCDGVAYEPEYIALDKEVIIGSTIN